MASLGQTLFRFTGAMLLAAGATAIDNPRVIADATVASHGLGDVPVVIALGNIPAGARIAPGAVAVVKWPAHVIPPGAYTSVESVVGKIAASAVFRGEPLMPGRLAQTRSTGREVRITPGKRAYSIRVGDVTGIAGMIVPNSRVDILVIVDRPGAERKQRMTKIFMTNMRVLAFGAQVQRGADGRLMSSHVATLEVSPEEAERLAIASSQGSLSLALRGYGDGDSIVTNVTVGVPPAEYFSNSATVVPRLRRP